MRVVEQFPGSSYAPDAYHRLVQLSYSLKNYADVIEYAADNQSMAAAGAVHSFTNPEATEFGRKFNLPLAYSEEADALSWTKTIRFLKAELF